jgi:hypothetical protein
MWAYDLHLYTVAYLTREPADDCSRCAARSLALLVPLFALASRRNAVEDAALARRHLPVALVLAILAYLIVMMSATRALEMAGGDWVRIGQIGSWSR